MLYDVNQRIEQHLRENSPRDVEMLPEDGDEVYSHAFWLNDLLFIVPPSHISIDTDYTIFQWKSLRTDTTVKTHSGNSSTYIKVDMAIPAGNSIINVNYTKPERTGRRGGLTDLILEFKYTPFCFLENAFVRSNLGIQNTYNMGVTLHQLSTSTVPGYPGLINVELLLGLFNYRPYSTNLVYRDAWNSKTGSQLTFSEANPSEFDTGTTTTAEIAAPESSHNPEDPQPFQGAGLDPVYVRLAIEQGGDPPDHLSPAYHERYVAPNVVAGSKVMDPPSEVWVPNGDTWLHEDLQDSDVRLIRQPDAVRTPAYSEVYTAYVDWLRSKWQTDGYSSEFQPIDSIDHNLGDTVELRWKEYARFEMPDRVWENIRSDVRDELENRRNSFDSSNELVAAPSDWLVGDFEDLVRVVNAPVTAPNRDQNLADYLVNQGGGRWAGRLQNHANEHGADRTPPRELWSNIVKTARLLDAVEELSGVRMRVGGRGSGFRGYDDATGEHAQYGAIDFYPRSRNISDLRTVQAILIHIYDRVGGEIGSGMGLGFYLYGNGDPRILIHVDTTKYQRRWIWRSQEGDDARFGDTPHGSTWSRNTSRDPTVVIREEWNRIRNAVSEAEIQRMVGFRREANELEARANAPDSGNTLVPPTPGVSEEPEGTVESPATEEMLGNLIRGNSKYSEWVSSIEAQGFVHYKSDISILDVFYTDRVLILNSNSTVQPPSPAEAAVAPIVTAMNVTLVNLFKELPLNGHTTPTAQFLGGMDTRYNLTIQCVTLDQLKDIKEMKQRLEVQARNFRTIPDSWVLNISNPYMNVFGHKWAVISSDATDTVPGSPGLYQVELEMVGHKPWTDRSGFAYIGTTDPATIYRAFFRDIVLERRFLTRHSTGSSTFTDSDGTNLDTIFDPGARAIEPNLSIGSALSSSQRIYIGDVDSLFNRSQATSSLNLAGLPAIDESGAGTLADPIRSGLIRLKIVVEQINNTLLHRNSQYGIDINAYDFLGLGPAALGDDSVIRRHGRHYTDDILLGLPLAIHEVDLNRHEIMGRFTTRLGTSILANDDLSVLDDPEMILAQIRGFEVPWPLEWTYHPGMVSDVPGGSSLISPRTFGNPELNQTWRDRPWLWNVGYVAHAAASTINLIRSGKYDTVLGSDQFIQIVDFQIDALFAGLRINTALDSVYREFYEEFWTDDAVSSGPNHLPRTLGRTDLVNGTRLSIPRNANVLTPHEERAAYLERLHNPPPPPADPTGAEARALNTGLVPGPEVQRVSPVQSGFPAGARGDIARLVRDASTYWVPTQEVLDQTLLNQAQFVNNLETYLYNSVFIPSLAACFSYTKMVNEWASFKDTNGDFVFPNLAREVQNQLLNAGGQCYPDLKLPSHPFWVGVDSAELSTELNASIFTEPDFYFYNWAFDHGAEDVEDIYGMTGLMVEETASTVMADWTPNADEEEPTAPGISNLVTPTSAAGGAALNMVGPTVDTVMETVWYAAGGIGVDLPDFSVDALLKYAARPGTGTLSDPDRRRQEAIADSIREDFDRLRGNNDEPPTSTLLSRKAIPLYGLVQRIRGTRTLENQAIGAADAAATFSMYLDKSPVTQRFAGNKLSDANNEMEAAMARNQMVRQALERSFLLNWRNLTYAFGRNIASHAMPEPTLRTRMGPVPLGYIEDNARGDATDSLWSRLGQGGIPGFFSNLFSGGINEVTQAAQEAWARSRRDAQELITGFSIPMPGHNSMGSWEDTRTYEASEVLDYSFSRDSLYYLAYEGMKDLDRKKLCMRRAFPTFKIYFVEYDSLENQWNALDDFYSYSQISSIRIVRSRKVPADLCVIEFINVGGSLDGNDQKTRLARLFNALSFDDNERRARVKPIGETNQVDFQDTAAEQSISGFVLSEGNTLKVALGFSNDAQKLEEVFLGQVVRVEHSHNADRISVVAQSYATELTAKVKGRTSNEVSGNTYKNTFDLLAHMMFEPEVMHFGRHTLNERYWLGENQSIAQNDYIINSQAGIPWGSILAWGLTVVAGVALLPASAATLPAVFAAGAGLGGIFRAIGRAFKNTSLTPNQGPQDDNIFVPDEAALVDHSWLFDDGPITSKNYEYNPVSTTIWDMFQEMTLRHPGWVASPVPYGNSARMTMFFGLPTQRYWARSASGFDNLGMEQLLDGAFSPDSSGYIIDPWGLRKYFNAVAKRFRPFRNYHIVTSQTDIIANNIVATKHGVFNTVSVHWWGGGPDEPEDATELSDNAITIKAVSDLEDSDIREAYVSYRNCKGKQLARRYGVASLSKHVKDMYKGSVIVLGNPRIKPYDLVYLSDSFVDMCGPIEVEEVVHTFSHETGFITEIVPDAFVIASDPGTFWTYFAQKYFVSQKIHKYMGHGSSIIPETYGSSRGAFAKALQHGLDPVAQERYFSDHPTESETQRFDPNPAVGPGSDRNDPAELLGTDEHHGRRNAMITGGAVGLASRSVPVVGAAVLSIGLWMLGDYLYYSWTRKRQAFFMCPLIKNGSPMTAGLPWTVNSSYIALVGSKVRRWFTHSEDGIVEWNYAAMQYRDAVWERLNGDIPALTRLIMNFRTGAGGVITGTTPW